jgi:hypothetical protein
VFKKYHAGEKIDAGEMNFKIKKHGIISALYLSLNDLS